MNRIICATATVSALLALSACDKKTSDDMKRQAEDAGKKIEAEAKEAKKAAEPKLKELEKKSKDAEPELKEIGEKTKEAVGAAAEKLKDATATSPTATPTP